jgi:hypothetical protein
VGGGSGGECDIGGGGVGEGGEWRVVIVELANVVLLRAERCQRLVTLCWCTSRGVGGRCVAMEITGVAFVVVANSQRWDE